MKPQRARRGGNQNPHNLLIFNPKLCNLYLKMPYHTVILSDSEEIRKTPFVTLRVTLQRAINKSVHNSG
jgi:hypothetical protein